MCPGCYKPKYESYCPSCCKQLFNGRKVKHILPFDAIKDVNLPIFQEKTKRLSISGVQLKYSLRLEGSELVLTENGGEYLLKPIPPAAHIMDAGQAPENEHLTMQIASQVFGINTAANALIYFKDGTPAYLTRRFDVKEDGTRYLQEDMTQLSGRSRQTDGENFKYNGTYEEVGGLIRQYVAAYHPAIERFFELVVFNYLFSNGDAHLKNFSLIQTPMRDYTLSKAYDLMSTVLRTPNESDTALDLYENDTDNEFYSVFGCYGQENFRILADKIGINAKRTERILTRLLSSNDHVLAMIGSSLLDERVKKKYQDAYLERIRRMGLTKTIVARTLNPGDTKAEVPLNMPVNLHFLRGTPLTGAFQSTPASEALAKQNKYLFVELENLENYKNTLDDGLLMHVDMGWMTAVEVYNNV